MNNDIWVRWIAIIGACAWLPPIIQLLIKRFTKPKLTIFPHRSFELGYTTNGSIINLSLALSAENSECLLTKLELDIEGPNHEQHKLLWQWIEEKLYEIDYSELGLTPVKKQQNAIAIKILKENLVEKTIGFHDIVFKSGYDNSYKLTSQRYELLTRNNQDINALRATPEYEAFRQLLENSLIWREGTYKAKIKATILNLSDPFIKEFEFTLSAAEVQRLQSNVQVGLAMLERHYFPQDEQQDEPKWNWINPKTVLTD